MDWPARGGKKGGNGDSSHDQPARWHHAPIKRRKAAKVPDGSPGSRRPVGTFWLSDRLSSVKRLFVLIALLLTACGTVEGPQSHGGPVQDQVSLIDALRAKNVTVDISGTVSQPFLSPESGTAARLGGGPLTTSADLQLLQYGSASAASADARQISPDGSGTATTKISWVAPPHFFLKGRVMVLYVGNDAAVLSLLQSLLGRQFAGR
jgi:hypothetical protein